MQNIYMQNLHYQIEKLLEVINFDINSYIMSCEARDIDYGGRKPEEVSVFFSLYSLVSFLGDP